jgi:hypothetical protein
MAPLGPEEPVAEKLAAVRELLHSPPILVVKVAV